MIRYLHAIYLTGHPGFLFAKSYNPINIRLISDMEEFLL